MKVFINLLPHRERKRKEKREEFYVLMGMIAALAAVITLAVVVAKTADQEVQKGINAFLKSENDSLDLQITEIAKLKEEIEALRARQTAVESLQIDRNQLVRVFDDLVHQIPEGAYLKAMKQEGKRLTLVGLAQSQERVSEVLRNMGNNALWLNTPDLIEIKSVIPNGKDTRRLDGRLIFEYSMTVGIKNAAPMHPADALSKPLSGLQPDLIVGALSPNPARSLVFNKN